jgi:hypothetical protein
LVTILSINGFALKLVADVRGFLICVQFVVELVKTQMIKQSLKFMKNGKRLNRQLETGGNCGRRSQKARQSHLHFPQQRN